MHLVVYGAGALGTLFGVKAAEGGTDVTLVGREAHVNVINEKGITIIGNLGTGKALKLPHLKAVTDIHQIKEPIRPSSCHRQRQEHGRSAPRHKRPQRPD